MDLSNSYGAASAIKSLKEARFVIIMSGKDQGSRNAGIIEMASILNELFPRYKEIAQSVVLLFNRYEEEDLKSMNARLKNIWKQLPATSRYSNNLLDIYNDFKKKTSENSAILNFNPLLSDLVKTKSILTSIMKYKTTNRLQNLFSVSYGKRAKNDIDKKTRILYDFCIHYFEAN